MTIFWRHITTSVQNQQQNLNQNQNYNLNQNQGLNGLLWESSSRRIKTVIRIVVVALTDFTKKNWTSTRLYAEIVIHVLFDVNTLTWAEFYLCPCWHGEFSTVTMNNYKEDDQGEAVYEDAGFVITDRDGNIVYREEGSPYSVTLVDENFCVLNDWNSGKYIIKDYNGRELFSWIQPEQNEYW